MRKTQRRILGTMLTLCDDNMEVEINIPRIAEKAGYSGTGGMITTAVEMLEHHNKIAKTGDGKWRITI